MEKNYSMTEMAKRKFELPFGAIFSFQQLDSLKQVKEAVNRLWKDHKKLWEYVEKVRVYALLIGKEKEWKEWKEKNKFSFVGFQKPQELFKTFKFRHCEYCGNPFAKGKANKIYCGTNCKQYAWLRKKKKKE